MRLLLAWSLNALVAGSAAAQAPQVNRLEPSALAPGRRTVLTLVGERLGGASQLWTSFSAEATPVSSTGGTDRAMFQVDLPAHTPRGIGALRVVSTNGVSAWSLVLIDDLPTVAASGTNRSRTAAQSLNPPAAVEGVCDELRSDYYRFSVRKGQRLSVDAVAHRTGSALDPVMWLFDAAGRQLASAEDTPGAGADGCFSHRFAATGDCFLELRDSTYEGGPKHRYRLRVGDFPLERLPFLVASNRFPRIQAGPAVLTGGEREPNDTPDRALALNLPCAIAGTFARADDSDFYKFKVTKGQRLVFRGRTRSLGSPCDLFLRIQSTNGAKVAEANVSGADDGTLTNTFETAGEYLLRVEELNTRGGKDLEYRIAVEIVTPGFTLSVETDRVSAPPGSNVEVFVSAERRDYNGPIALSLAGLPGEFALAKAEFPAKTNGVKLRMTVPPDAELGQLLPFALIGQATINEVSVEARASTMPALRVQFPAMLWPPAELDGWLTLGVTASRSDAVEPKPKRKRK